MKKITFLVGITFLSIGTALLSCSKSEVSPPVVEKVVEPAEPFESEIALREKELGVIYFKKDVVLIDKSGENKVTMRYASLDENELNNYLANVKYEIVPILKGQSPTLQGGIATEKSTSTEIPSNTENKPTIITEVVSQKLQKGVSGYYVNVKSNLQNNLKVATSPGGYATYTEHVSPEDWAERFHFTRHDGQGMHYFLKHKNGGAFQNYQTAGQLYQVSPWNILTNGIYGPGSVTNDFYINGYDSPTFGTDYVYSIDGPKKFILWIEYNNYASYSFYFEQL